MSHPNVATSRRISVPDEVVQAAEKESKEEVVATTTPEQDKRLVDFSELVFLGKMNSTVDIAGWSFSLQTLTGKEQRELLSGLMKIEAEQRLTYAKPLTLSISIGMINGVAMEDASKSAGFDSPFDFVCSWQDSLIEKLYTEYETLFGNSSKVLDGEDLERFLDE